MCSDLFSLLVIGDQQMDLAGPDAVAVDWGCCSFELM